MNPYQEEIYAVKPGSVVLMYGSKLVGLIIGVYKLKDSEYDEYHIMWAYEDGEIGLYNNTKSRMLD